MEQLPGQYGSGDLIGICLGRSRKEGSQPRGRGSRCLFLVLMMAQPVVRCPRGRFLKIDAMAATRSSAFSAPTIAKWKMGHGGNLTWDLDSWVKLGVRGNEGLGVLGSLSGFPRAPPPQPPPPKVLPESTDAQSSGALPLSSRGPETRCKPRLGIGTLRGMRGRPHPLFTRLLLFIQSPHMAPAPEFPTSSTNPQARCPVSPPGERQREDTMRK